MPKRSGIRTSLVALAFGPIMARAEMSTTPPSTASASQSHRALAHSSSSWTCSSAHKTRDKPLTRVTRSHFSDQGEPRGGFGKASSGNQST
ncbi:hypothetical protein BCR34DRAFT_556195 [Clohesyomyces aquaticus]|uniref:Secreted protein n=1 Tax=Clohesyomyces aquaticus TaxID=1231657 RepID=A0A1Y2A2X9_9PLEO|nr:hypothetical protein BCR34DRAFT_556195 [Clohesyomyces aquaticus]